MQICAAIDVRLIERGCIDHGETVELAVPAIPLQRQARADEDGVQGIDSPVDAHVQTVIRIERSGIGRFPIGLRAVSGNHVLPV